QEEAEVDEVLAEIGGAARRFKTPGSYGEDRKAHFSWVNGRPKLFAIGLRRRKDADRREPTEARAPELLASRERAERFRGSPVLVPVLLVDRPDAAQVKRKRRIPIVQALGLSDPRILRRELLVRRRAFGRDYPCQTELCAVRMQTTVRFPDIVVE